MKQEHEPLDMSELKQTLAEIAAPYIPMLREMGPKQAALRMRTPDICLYNPTRSEIQNLADRMGVPEPAKEVADYSLGIVQCFVESEDGSRVELEYVLNLAVYSKEQRAAAMDTDMYGFAEQYGWRPEEAAETKHYSIWFVRNAPPEMSEGKPEYFQLMQKGMVDGKDKGEIKATVDVIFVYFDREESTNPDQLPARLDRALRSAPPECYVSGS